MKAAFVKFAELLNFIPGVLYCLQTDASDSGICGVIFQRDKEGNNRIISIVSRCLNSAEKNYTTTEKELLTIVYSVEKFRTYLIGTRFEIKTDHKGLTFLHSTVYLSSRLIRWSLVLRQYDFEVSYCTVGDNVVADFSRNPRGFFENPQTASFLSIDVLHMPTEPAPSSFEVCQVEYDRELCESLRHLSILQREVKTIEEIRIKVLRGDDLVCYVIKGEVLFFKDNSRNVWHIVIPSKLNLPLMDCIHSKLGHPGVYKTPMYAKESYFWKKK